MLMEELGYRPAGGEPQAVGRLQRIRQELANRTTRRQFWLPVALLSKKPYISYSGIVPEAPLGLASVMSGVFAPTNAWFLLSPTWSIETEPIASALRSQAVEHRLLHPGHKIIFMCNTAGEADLLRHHGEAAFHYNKTSNVLESVFKPLDDVPVEFDAIYNARLLYWKRHELARDIERCAFVYYRSSFDAAAIEEERAVIVRQAEIAPNHVFVNKHCERSGPERLDPEEVNFQLNRADVGLCLSAEEGAMFASTEYLLAGLPVVSTQSIGGRSDYYDEDVALIVDADPRSVAEGVAAMQAKKLPRSMVRERTLARVRRDRERFIDLLNSILQDAGADGGFAISQILTRPVLMQWFPWRKAVRRARWGILDVRKEDRAHRAAAQVVGTRR